MKSQLTVRFSLSQGKITWFLKDLVLTGTPVTLIEHWIVLNNILRGKRAYTLESSSLCCRQDN